MKSRYTHIEEAILPAIESYNCYLYGLELIQGGKRQVLRVLIESKEGAVTINEISKISRQMSRVLDVAEVIKSEYTLEVSSPGLDRPLLQPAHFAKAIGETIAVQLSLPHEGRKKFNGQLLAADDTTCTLLVDAESHQFDLCDIQKARVVPEIKIGRGQES